MARRLLVAGLLLFLGSAGAAHAATFTVATTDDGVDLNAGDGVCLSPGRPAACTLRAAVMEANAMPGLDHIRVPGGTYVLTLAGRGEDGAISGDLDVTDDLELAGDAAATTVIEGDPPDAVPDRIFDVHGVTARFAKVAIRHGDPGDAKGGGVRNQDGKVTIVQVAVDANDADEGGGIANGELSMLTIDQSTIGGNSAQQGGGILNEGSMDVSESVIAGNTATGEGGGLMNREQALVGLDVTFDADDVVFSANKADRGGAISNAFGEVLLDNVSVNQNDAALSGGGVRSTGPLEARGSTFTSNSTGGAGGGIYASARLELTDVTVAGNEAELGAGLFIDEGDVESGGGHAELERVEVVGNVAATSGGGVANLAELELESCNVNGNVAGSDGGGILNGGDLSVAASKRVAGAPALHTEIVGNTAAEDGGGLYNASHSSAELPQVTIDSNTSGGSGGGIANADATLELARSTVSANVAALSGGGIQNFDLASATLVNDTVSANVAGKGAAIANQGVLGLTNVTIHGGGRDLLFNQMIGQSTTFELKNVIVDAAPGGLACVGDPVISLGHNLESTDTCQLSAAGDLSNTDPQLGPLQANGGPTLTHALPQSSPAVDSGTSNGCPSRDQRGVTRPRDGDGDGFKACDIGSYEFAR